MKIHLSNDVCKSCLSSYFMQCSTQLLKYVEGFCWLSVNSQFFREWNMSEKKKRKELDNEPVSSVSWQRNKDWTVIQGLYNLIDPLSSLCFMSIFFWNTKSGLLGEGGALVPPPPHFSRGKMSLFKYKAHVVSRVPVILHLIQAEDFREISHWVCCECCIRAPRFQNFLGEDSPDHPLPPRNSRLRRDFLRTVPSWNCSPPSLLMTLYGYFQRNQSRDDRLRCGCSSSLLAVPRPH